MTRLTILAMGEVSQTSINTLTLGNVIPINSTNICSAPTPSPALH